MSTRRHISSDIKEHIVLLASRYENTEIVANIMEVSVRTVRRVLKLAQETGKVVRKPQRTRPRLLNGLHLAVCILLRYELA